MKILLVSDESRIVIYDLYNTIGYKLGTVKHDIILNEARFITNESVENDRQTLKKIVLFMESITLG